MFKQCFRSVLASVLGVLQHDQNVMTNMKVVFSEFHDMTYTHLKDY